MKDNFTEFGKYMRQRREAMELTQGNIAKELDVHVQFISNIERGLCLIPADKLVKLANILKCDPYQMALEAAESLAKNYCKRALGKELR